MLKYLSVAALALALILVWPVGLNSREAESEVHTTYSCTSTSGEALAANGGRIAALFVNDGTVPAYLRIDATSVASEGIRINANGGSYYISDEEGNLDREAVNCVTAVTTVVILVIEWSTL